MLLVFTCIGFSIVGYILFSPEMNGIGNNMYFENLIESLYQMLVLMTTANFPDIMMQSYTTNNTVIIYFILYLLIVLYLLLQLVLAIIYAQFQTLAKISTLHITETQILCYCAAFQLLQ